MLKFVCKRSCINGFRPLRHVFSSSSYSSLPTKQQQQKEHLPYFLVENLGFSVQQSLSISDKIAACWRGETRVSALTSNANSVIHLFKSHGFNVSQIRNVVSYYPRILTIRNVNQTLIPKLKVFQDLGISDSDLVCIISSKPSLIHGRLETVLQDLRVFLGTFDNLLAFLKGSSSFAPNISSLGYVVSNGRLLQNDYGISTDILRHHIINKQSPFMRNPTLFKDTLIKVEHKWGISPSSGMFLYGVETFCSLTAELIESKIRLFKSFGWNQSHIMTLINKLPQSLRLSEAKLRKSLEFFMNEMGYEPAYLASRPALLSYSLEKRLLPRQRILVVLRENGLISTPRDFYSVAALTESKFFHKFVQPFKDVATDLYQNYLSSRGCPTLRKQKSNSQADENKLGAA